MKKIVIVILILTSNVLFAQQSLNLDFEIEIPGKNAPKYWYIGDKGYKITLDDAEKPFSSKKSLKMESNNPKEKQFGVCTNRLPVEHAINKSIEFRGKIKTKSVKNGTAYLWMRKVGENGSKLGFEHTIDKQLKGDTNWTEVSLQMEINEEVKKILFGGVFNGEGVAWFDNFEIFINGIKFEDIEPKIIKPTKERQAWLREQIYPLKSFDPKFQDTEDLEILGKLVGDSKVVALGEVTHGSSEIFQMKHRIVKYLTQKKNFDIFSIEANMPESYKINSYTFDGKGKPEELIGGMYFWTWRTQEVLEMVEWMKEQNKTDKKIQFTGFDMQYFKGSVRELEQAFKDKPKLLKLIDELDNTLDSLKENSKKSRGMITQDFDKERVNELLTNITSAIEISSYKKEEQEWYLRNTRIIEQFLDNSYTSRDKYMAENIKWIKEQNTESKIAVWAHNGHIKKTGYSMGKFLSQTLKEDYLTIGFTFYKGKYTAVGNNGLNTYDAQEAYEGTFEYIFQSIDEPIFLLDLKKIRNDESEHGKWMKENLEFRRVGARKVPSEFKETNLLDDFDMLIFINESTSSTLLK